MITRGEGRAGKGKLVGGGLKAQISIISSRDVMYNMINIANTAVCYI